MRLTVDKELLPMKAHYFLFYAGTAPSWSFVPTLAKQLGFSTVIVGTMYTLLPLIVMLVKTLFCYLADRYQRHRQIFLISQIITGVAFFLIMFIPAIPQPPAIIQFHCHAGASELRSCSTLDTCAEYNLGTHFGTEVVACELHCKAESYMWNIVCEDWLPPNSTQCNSSINKRSSYLDITTNIDMSNIKRLDECLVFTIKNDVGIVNGENVVLNCPKEKQYFNASCEIDCNDQHMVNELADSSVIKNSDAIGLYQFWLFFGLVIISGCFMSIAVSVGDAICFVILAERYHLFGNQLLWGSVGWGLFSIIFGVLVDVMSNGSATKDYTIVFWVTLVMIGFDVFASWKLKPKQTHFSPNILKDVCQIFLSIRCVIFFIWCILIGIFMALIYTFLFWYLEDLSAQREGCKNSMKTLQGLAIGIQCFGGELPSYFLSGRIFKKIGHINAMSLVLFGFGVRFILYSILEDPWYVLPIELLNGINFGLFYATMTSFASIVAPPGTEATIQGLVSAIFEGIGVSIGSFIGGQLFNVVGGAQTFEIFAITAFIAFIVHVCLQMFLRSKQTKGSVQ